MKTELSKDIIINRLNVQLQEWQVAKLDATIAHDTHKEIGSKDEVIESLAQRVIDAEKAIRSLKRRIEEIANPVMAEYTVKDQ